MSSTETGHIFGTIVYENSSTAEKTYINLNDIHMDIMDYIKPASCSEEAFRSMWAEFEWENKVGRSPWKPLCFFVSFVPVGDEFCTDAIGVTPVVYPYTYRGRGVVALEGLGNSCPRLF